MLSIGKIISSFCGFGVARIIALTMFTSWKSPNNSPYYAVVFLNENQPLLPELLVKWLERLSYGLFAESFDFVLENSPSQEEAKQKYKEANVI